VFGVPCAEYLNAVCLNARCLYVKGSFTECRYVECNYVDYLYVERYIMLRHIVKVSMLLGFNMPSVILQSASILSVVMFSVADAQCQYAECPCNNFVAK